MHHVHTTVLPTGKRKLRVLIVEDHGPSRTGKPWGDSIREAGVPMWSPPVMAKKASAISSLSDLMCFVTDLRLPVHGWDGTGPPVA